MRALTISPTRLRARRDARRERSALVGRYQARRGEATLRVVVLTARVGEGHAAAARALAADLVREQADVEVLVCDALVGLGGFLRYVLLDAYRWQLARAPWIFDLLYRLLTRVRLLRGLSLAGLALLGARPLLRLISAYRPDIVVSTYPAATIVLGSLRRRGRVTVPTCATVTDLAGLEFWAHPGIDLHLVMHASCVKPVERVAGVGSARRVRPLVAPEFFAPCSRERARRELGLPPDRPVLVVSGGGWGVGDIEGAVWACLQQPAAVVVCVTGRNEPLEKRLSRAFAAERRVRILGFTDRMSELLAAADALVHSTGGVTCLEALVRGCPIVAYGAPPGHAPLTADAMTTLGLLRSAGSPAELVAALGDAVSQPAGKRPRLEPAPSAGSLVLAAERRVQWAGHPRRRVPRLAVAAATMVAFGGWAFLSDDAYPLFARTLDLEPLSTVATKRPQVGLVIRVAPSLVPDVVGFLEQHGAHASFAFAAAPDRRTLRALRLAGDQPLPELRRGGLVHWLETKGELTRAQHALGLPDRRYYLAPELTTSQYLLGRDIGAVPIRGSVNVGPDDRVSARGFHRGDVVVLSLGSHSRRAGEELGRVLAALAHERLTPVSFGRLAAQSG